MLKGNMSDPSGDGNVLHLVCIHVNILCVMLYHSFARWYHWGRGGGDMGPLLFLATAGNPRLSQNKDFDFKKLPVSGEGTLTSFPTRSSLFSTMPHGAIPIAQTRPLDLEEWSFKASPTWLITPVTSHESYF